MKTSIKKTLGWAWRWSLVVTAPVGCIFLLWAARTTTKYWHLGVQYRTLSDYVSLPRIGAFEARMIQRDLELAVLSRAARSAEGLRILQLYLPESSEEALLAEIPHSGRDYVEGSFVYPDGDIYPVKVKLRGDHHWHWSARKQSLRIKTKRSQLWERMRAINLSAPKLKDQIFEHVSYWLAKEMGLMAPRSEMVEFFVNGDDRGVYLLVEQLEEMTIRTNGKMPGDLYSGDITRRDSYRGLDRKIFKNSGLWEKVAVNNHFPDDEDEALEQLIASLAAPASLARTQRLRSLVDIDAFGAFAAYRVICQTKHYDSTHNWRLYYDPWRNHFLPVVWDPVGWHESWVPKRGASARLDMITSRLDEVLLEDVRFLDARQAALDHFYESGLQTRLFDYIDQVVAETAPSLERDPGLSSMLKALTPADVARAQAETRRQAVNIASTLDVAYRTAPKLRYALAPKELHSFRFEVDGRRGLSGVIVELDRTPTGPVNAHVSWATSSGFERVDVSGAVVQQGTRITIDRPLFAQFPLRFVEGMSALNSLVVDVLPATYDVALSGAGLDGVEIVAVAGRMGASRHVSAKDVPALDVLPITQGRAVVDAQPRSLPQQWSGELTFEGDTWIDDDVVIAPGTLIKMAPSASVFFEGRLTAKGTQAEPIRVLPAEEGQDPWGVFAIRGEGADGSRMSWCELAHGSGYKVPLAEFSAMLSIHDVDDMIVESCFLRDSHVVDDMVHVVYSTVRLENCTFARSLFDAVDIDISEAVVEGCRFIQAGNDALDLMTSTVVVVDNWIEGSVDKGVSVGEDTRAFISNCAMIDCEIGVQIKDRSRATIYNCELRDNVQAIDAYKKNWRYDSGGFGYVYKSILTGNQSTLTADKHSRLYVHDSVVQPSVESTKRIIVDETCDEKERPNARMRALRRLPEDEAHTPDMFRPYWQKVDPLRRGLKQTQ